MGAAKAMPADEVQLRSKPRPSSRTGQKVQFDGESAPSPVIVTHTIQANYGIFGRNRRHQA